MKSTKKGLSRIIAAYHYSLKGLRACWQHEAAFREECMLLLVMLPVAAWLAASPLEFLLLVGSAVLVLIVELINSALEAVVDRVGSEFHELSGRAKDIGSAAVMVTMLLCAFTWLIIVFA